MLSCPLQLCQGFLYHSLPSLELFLSAGSPTTHQRPAHLLLTSNSSRLPNHPEVRKETVSPIFRDTQAQWLNSGKLSCEKGWQLLSGRDEVFPFLTPLPATPNLYISFGDPK